MIQSGTEVDNEEKHHQRTGEFTRGFVAQIPKKSPNHSHEIKVKLKTAEGIVKYILEE